MLSNTQKFFTLIVTTAAHALLGVFTSLILALFPASAAIATTNTGAPVPGENAPVRETHDSTPVSEIHSSMSVTSWKDLKDPAYLTQDKEVSYYDFATNNGSRAYLVVANYKSGHYTFKPVVAPVKTPVSVTANQDNVLAAVNAAYFNMSDGLSVGYIYVNGNMITDPQKNLALYENEKLRPYLPFVFNRTELRFLKDPQGESQIQIARHQEPLLTGCKLMDSLQSGPRLLPEITEEQEAFVRKDPDTGKVVDAINSHRYAARTAFGITNNGYALMLCVASPNQSKETDGVTLTELAEIMKQLGCIEAINFDGGASTTMVVNFHNTQTPTSDKSGTTPDHRFTVVCGRNPETHVKSILMLVRS